MKKEKSVECNPANLRAIKDAMEVLNGSWKLQILVSLSEGPKRFKQITREVEGISDKMLSKELKDLEANQLLTRAVHTTFPPTVEYELTKHAYSLHQVMAALKDWGKLHRNKIFAK
ncbi:MAG: helix-turn-helix domain-containing protein [Ferruginibacter sp.]